MKRTWAMLLVVVLPIGWLAADDLDDKDGPIPKTPTAFETRNTGEETGEEADFLKKKVKPKKLAFTAVSGSREWRDAKGSVILARLLAFEPGDKSGSDEALTLVKDGKVRLLVAGRNAISEIPLATLSVEDQVFVRGLIAARKKAAATSNTGGEVDSRTK